MLQKYALLFLITLIYSTNIYAQPAPCGDVAAMQPFCVEACVICDIDGFTGVNNGPPLLGVAPSDFCTTTQHNIQWIAFIAGSTNLTLNVDVYDCDLGGGLEVAIYESFDCVNFNMVSNCDGDIEEGEIGVFTNNEPLNIGQYYYFVMDGNMTDICSYTITVADGTTLVPPLPDAQPIQGPENPCTGQPVTYSIPPIVGATFYDWYVDGVKNVTTNPSYTTEFANTGSHEICVTTYNVCDSVPEVCFTVNVDALPATGESVGACTGFCATYNGQQYCTEGTFPVVLTSSEGCDSLILLDVVLYPIIPVTVLDTLLCVGDCYDYYGTPYCEAGDYPFMYSSTNGCDSAVLLTFDFYPTVVTNAAISICNGDTYTTGGQDFMLAGTYPLPFSNNLGCDSTVLLTLSTLICTIAGNIDTDSTSCTLGSDGTLTFNMTDGFAPYTYNWTNTIGTLSGSGSFSNTGSIDSLAAGEYSITITDAFGNLGILNSFVFAPPLLTTSTLLSQYDEFNVSCINADDGTALVAGAGGIPPYTFQWSTGSNNSQINNLTAGTYIYTLTDSRACPVVDSVLLVEPDSIIISFEIENPSCDSLNSGIISVSASGTKAPYLYSFENGSFDTLQVFTGLSPAEYAFVVEDDRGCTQTGSAEIITPLSVTVEAGPDQEIILGDSTKLTPFIWPLPDTVSWSPVYNLNCPDCPITWVRPFQTTTYTITTWTPNDCPISDSLTIFVKNETHIFVPNVFTPNADGQNDFLTVFTSQSVKLIKNLVIYDRWGERVFEISDIPPGIISQGWDGKFRGKPVESGTFAWVADIELWNDTLINAKGDVTVVR